MIPVHTENTVTCKQRQVKGFRIVCYTQRRSSPVNRGFEKEGIPDCLLHIETTVTCKQRFQK